MHFGWPDHRPSFLHKTVPGPANWNPELHASLQILPDRPGLQVPLAEPPAEPNDGHTGEIELNNCCVQYLYLKQILTSSASRRAWTPVSAGHALHWSLAGLTGLAHQSISLAARNCACLSYDPRVARTFQGGFERKDNWRGWIIIEYSAVVCLPTFRLNAWNVW